MNYQIPQQKLQFLSTAWRGVRDSGAADEFTQVAAVLFVAVSAVRWLRDPGSAVSIGSLPVALAVIGPLSGAVLTALILSPPGRRSGGHMNPAVTIALWLMGAFPGRKVVPYVLAQLAGSAAGVVLARIVWGRAVTLPSVAHAVIRPAVGWNPIPVFAAEAGAMAALIALVGVFMVGRRTARLVPFVIGGSVALVIVFQGPYSGGSINPAREFGPALLSGRTTDLWIYLLAPAVGAALGAAVHRTVTVRLSTARRVPPTAGPAEASGRIADGQHPVRRCAFPRRSASSPCVAPFGRGGRRVDGVRRRAVGVRPEHGERERGRGRAARSDSPAPPAR